MKRFRTVHYTIHSEKIKDARGVRFAVIADLHGVEFGPDNHRLLETINKYRPDGILIAGDMIVRNDSESMQSQNFMWKICGRSRCWRLMERQEAFLWN